MLSTLPHTSSWCMKKGVKRDEAMFMFQEIPCLNIWMKPCTHKIYQKNNSFKVEMLFFFYNSFSLLFFWEVLCFFLVVYCLQSPTRRTGRKRWKLSNFCSCVFFWNIFRLSFFLSLVQMGKFVLFLLFAVVVVCISERVWWTQAKFDTKTIFFRLDW